MIKRFYNGVTFSLTHEGAGWMVLLSNHNLQESPTGYALNVADALRELADDIDKGEILQGPPDRQGCAT